MKTLRIKVYDYIDAEVEDDVTIEEVCQKLDVYAGEFYRFESSMNCEFQKAHFYIDKDEDGWDVDIIED
jgi:hypothetical protein